MPPFFKRDVGRDLEELHPRIRRRYVLVTGDERPVIEYVFGYTGYFENEILEAQADGPESRPLGAICLPGEPR